MRGLLGAGLLLLEVEDDGVGGLGPGQDRAGALLAIDAVPVPVGDGLGVGAAAGDDVADRGGAVLAGAVADDPAGGLAVAGESLPEPHPRLSHGWAFAAG